MQWRLIQISIVFAAMMAGNGESTPQPFSEIHQARLPANGRSCSECHLAPEIGGSSAMTVIRAGRVVDGKYFGVENGGILHLLNTVSNEANPPIHGARVSLNLLGDGYIESVPDSEFVEISRKQIEQSAGRIHG